MCFGGEGRWGCCYGIYKNGGACVHKYLECLCKLLCMYTNEYPNLLYSFENICEAKG